VERMQEDNWVNRVSGLNVDGRAIRGLPRKTWDKVIKSDLRVLGLDREAAKDRAAWRTAIRKTRLTHASVY